jgi:hypothetical protein
MNEVVDKKNKQKNEKLFGLSIVTKEKIAEV